MLENASVNTCLCFSFFLTFIGWRLSREQVSRESPGFLGCRRRRTRTHHARLEVLQEEAERGGWWTSRKKR